MQAQTIGSSTTEPFGGLGAAHILLAADSVAVRLTLCAVLEKSGYLIETAASSGEAMEKIETGQYALVLCALAGEGPDACERVFDVAEAQEYHPATAAVSVSPEMGEGSPQNDEMLVQPVDVPRLLTQIADLLANRAYGRAAAAAARKAG